MASLASRRIPARTQLLAVAWLRWRIFVNNTLRRRPSGARQVVSFLLAALLRLVVWGIFALGLIGAIVFSGFFAWQAIAAHHPQWMISLLLGICLLWQFANIQGLGMAATLSSFDPSSLARFPLTFPRYLLLRTLFGLLTPTTIVGSLSLLAAALGIGIANQALLLSAFVVLAVYAWMNIFFARMIAAWLERWLAGRRFREIFMAIMALAFLGIEFVNLQVASSTQREANVGWLSIFLSGPSPFMRWLPPGFAANSILLESHPLAALAPFAALLASTAAFLAVYTLRIYKQFLGEYLSDTPSRPGTTQAHQIPAGAGQSWQPRPFQAAWFSPVIAACFRKEWVSLRGSGAQLIGLLSPLLILVLFSRGSFFEAHPALFLPAAIGYVLFFFLAGLYNIFGADGPGVQVYLLAPVRLRDVVIAKNAMSLLLLLLATTLAWAVVLLIAKTPVSLSSQVSTALWAIFLIAINLTLGTLRSIQAPRKPAPGQSRQIRGVQTHRTSSLLAIAALAGSLLLQIPVLLLSRHFHQPWLGVLVFAPLAAAAIGAYALLLRYADRLILSHRDLLAEELCRI